MANSSSTKDIIGGMDTGGGVGFGIPADWGGGVQDGEPDPVIDKYNALAEKRLGDLILPPVRSVETPLTEKYKALPEDNPIRARAVEFEKRYSTVKFAYASAVKQLHEQKEAALRLREVANGVASDIREKQSGWEEEIVSHKQHEFAESFSKSLTSWGQRVKAVLDDYVGLRLWQVSPKFSEGFATLVSFNAKTDNPFDQDRLMDKAIQAFDEAVNELHETGEKGNGQILTDVKVAEKEYVEYTEGLRRMTEDIDKAAALQASGNTSASKAQMLRLLEDENTKDVQRESDTTVPENVPNYRLALETSPRVCGSCRFFEWKKGTDRGQCHAFDFEARAKYTCDAWQADSLTSVHTAVRDEGQRKMYRRKDADDNWDEPIYTSPVTDKDGRPKEIHGKVPGQIVGEHNINELDMYIYEDVNYSDPEPPAENAALRATEGSFLPGDMVYSRSLRTLAVVQGSVPISGNTVYSLKLVDSRGGAWGSGISYGDDLQPRSKTAMKTRRRRRAKAADVADMVEVTRSVYKALKEIVDAHEDLVSMPLSNKDVLTPLQQDMLSVMEDPMFDNITTGPKRKYFRALQTATHSIGAARQVLFEGYKTINVIRRQSPSAKSQMRNVMMKAQEGAYYRVKEALKQVEDALTLPSATHDEPPPGLKKVFRRGMRSAEVKEDLVDLASAMIEHDNLKVESQDSSSVDAPVEFEVSKFARRSDAEEASDLLAKMMGQIRSIENASNVDVDITDSAIQRASSKGANGFHVSVKFTITPSLN